MTDHTLEQKTKLLTRMDAGLTSFNAYLDTLTESQLTNPTDEAGWTAKDHVIHLAVWAESMVAVMDRKPRWEAMGVSRELWRTIVRTYDEINADIQQRHREMSLSELRSAFDRAHQAVAERVDAMTEDELQRPYSYYQPWAADETSPLHLYLLGNTADHYYEHQEYIAGIVGA